MDQIPAGDRLPGQHPGVDPPLEVLKLGNAVPDRTRVGGAKLADLRRLPVALTGARRPSAHARSFPFAGS